MAPKEQKIDEYFIKYLDEQFKGVNARFDSFLHENEKNKTFHDGQIAEIKKDLDWAKKKIIFAMGGLCIILGLGTYITISFKTLNQKQIDDSLKPLETKVQQAQNTAESTDKTLQAIISNYDIRVLKQYGK